MKDELKILRSISRRDTLKVCLLPAGAITAGWLVGCGGDDGANPGGVTSTPAAGQSAPGAAGQGTAAGATGAAGTTTSASAGAPGAAAGAGASGSAGAATAGSGGASPAAGSGGAPAGGTGAPPAGSGAGAGAGAGGGPTTAAGSGGSMSPVAGMDVPWATGGTKSMMGNYPDPFMSGMSGTPCMVYPTQTLGPCYAQMPMMRVDISDGMPGLPVRVSFLVVRGNGCTPVPDATVDIWHSGFDGVYSSYASGTICNPGDESTRDQMFCRGVQVTDANGRADFNTIFPGWYTGRTIHIHFTVRVGGRATVTSQLYFEDALSDEILGQGEYMARGRRDTTNMRDSTFRSGGASPDEVIMSTAKRPDGVLHAWKVLAVG